MKISKNLIAFFIFLFCSLTQAQTVVDIKGNEFYINGKPTYEGRYWNGNKIEGLLINSRMVQGIFDNLNGVNSADFAYKDTGKWDPERNTNEFIAAMPLWKSYGLNCFTLNMQGGSPYGYGNADFMNPGFNPDGSLQKDYMKRLDKILKKADDLKMVVILGLFYFGQDQRLTDETAVKNATINVTKWLFKKGYRNVIIEINNETLKKSKPEKPTASYDHEILLVSRVNELIDLVKSIHKNGYRYLVGTSFPAGIVPTKNVVDASDFVIFHGNALRTPEKFIDHIQKVKEVVGQRKMPIVINEDDNFDFNDASGKNNNSSHFTIAIQNYISWGYFDYRKKGVTDLAEGYQSLPVDWGINSANKKAFFEKVKEITGVK